MPDSLRFGILGCGVIGPQHALALSGLPDEAELVAVADPVADRAEKLAGKYGCASYGDAHGLLAHPGLDAVCVCTPSGMHARYAVEALEAGKHVVVEKPVDVSLPAIDALIAAQKRSGRKVAVISQHRFDPATQIVREATIEGRFGRLTLGAGLLRWWRSQGYYDSGDWRGTWALDGGGALMNQGIHTLDLLIWLMDSSVKEVSAYAWLLAHEGIEVEDTAVAVLRFESGALGIMQATTAAYPGLTARIEISGSRGSATIDNDRLAYYHEAAPGPDQEGAAYGASGGGNQAEQVLRARSVEDAEGPTAGADPASLSMTHRDQLLDFIRAVREDREPLVNVEEGRRVVAVILAIYESARTGQPVRLG